MQKMRTVFYTLVLVATLVTLTTAAEKPEKKPEGTESTENKEKKLPTMEGSEDELRPIERDDCEKDTAAAAMNTKIETACKSLNEALKNATTEAAKNTAMIGVCDSACGKEVVEQNKLAIAKKCLAKSYRGMAKTCVASPECFSKDYFDLAEKLTCLKTDAVVKSFLAVEAGVDATPACAAPCITDHVSALGPFSRCPLGGVKLVAEVLCKTVNNQTCYKTVRALKGMSCNHLTADQCKGSNVSCALNSDGKCQSKAVSEAKLKEICTPCLKDFLGATRFTKRSSGADLGQQISVYCMKDGDTYCFPKVQAIFTTKGLFDATDISTLVVSTRLAVIKDVCPTAAGRRCARRTFFKMQRFDTKRAVKDAERCVKGGAQNATATKLKTNCGRQMSALQNASKATSVGMHSLRMMCSTDDAGDYCMPKIAAVVSQKDCYKESLSGCTTSTSCSNYLTQVEALGCCAKVYTASKLFKPVVPRLPKVRVEKTAEEKKADASDSADFTPSAPKNDPADKWTGNYWQKLYKCAAANTDAFKAKMTTACKSQQRVNTTTIKKEFPVEIMWSKMKGDSDMKMRVESALQADMAAALGIDEAGIESSSIGEKAGKKSRRADAASTVSFTVDADTDAETSEGSDAFDAQQADSSLELLETGELTASDDCEDCVSNTDSTGSGTDDLFGTSSTIAASSAVSAAMFSAAAAAVFSALLL